MGRCTNAYEYNGYEPPYYPARTRLLFKGRGSEIECRAYEVLSVKASSRVLPENLFSPDQFLRENSIPLRYLTNGSIYQRLPSGQLLKTPGASPKLALSKRDYYENRYAYLAMALVSTLFLCLGLRSSAHERSKKGKP